MPLEIYAPTPDFQDIYSYGFSKQFYKIPITGIKIGEESNDIFYNLISESINPEMLKSGNLNGIITLVAGNLQSSTFVTAVRGWRISSSGDVEFSTGTFRGHVKGGQTDYNTGTGFFLGLSGGSYKLSIGNSASDYFLWDGVNLEMSGFLTTNFFSDGSDGDVTIAADASLTKDMYYDDLTVNSGKILSSAGYRIYCRGILTNNGTITASGLGVTVRGGGTSGAGGGTGGAGGNGGGVLFISAKTLTNNGNINANGVNGVAGSGSGPSEIAGSNGTAIDCSKGGAGGAGGSGGGTGDGGAGGSVTAATLAQQDFSNNYIAQTMLDFRLGKVIGGGGGGGGGGCDNDPGGSGGGGGGGGGLVLLFYHTATWNVEQAIGGIGGAKTGTGVVGTNGSDGTVMKIEIN